MDPSTDDVSFPDFVDAPPDAERATLHGLSPSAFREKALSLARKHQNIALAYLSIHNAAAPIFALPTEILSMILALCWYNRASLRVAHVCRRWRAVALKTPDLWADAVRGERFHFDISDCPPEDDDINRLEYIKVVAGRSAPRRLRFQATFAPILSNLLQCFASRLVSLDVKIHSECSYQTLFSVLESGMLALEDLNVSFGNQSRDDDSEDHSDDFSDEGPWYEDWDTRPLQNTRLCLPNLKKICVPGLMFPDLACETLQSVTVKRLFYNDPDTDITRIPSLYHLYQGLKRCPDLRSLKFVDTLPEELSTIPRSHSFGKLDLPRLETLSVTESSLMEGDTRVAAILSDLSLPALVNLSVTEQTGVILSRNPLLEDIKVIHELLHTVDSVQIQDGDMYMFGLYEFSLSATQQNVNRLFVKCQQRFFSAEALIAIFRSCAYITHLSIKLSQGHPFSNESTLFRAFPHLSSLHIACPESASLLVALQEPDDPHNLQSVVAPSLRTLDVAFQLENFGDVTNALRALIYGTQGEGAPQAVLTKHLRARSSILSHTLQHRASRGSRLTTLTWSEFKEDSLIQTRGLASLSLSDVGLDTVEFGLATLQGLVDGQVTFDVFRVSLI